MKHRRRLHAPTALILALVVALALAATAAAETRSGEATSPANGLIPQEADLLHATATYDRTAGTVTFTTTTAAAPGEESELAILAGLGVHIGAVCSAEELGLPAMQVLSPYSAPLAIWMAFESEEEEGIFEEGMKTANGTTTILSAASSELANKPYNCAVAEVIEFGGEFEELDEVSFPISAPPGDELPSVTDPGSPNIAPPPPSTPGALSIAKSKGLKLKQGKWAKVKVKLSNPGGTAIGPVKLKAKAPAGVVLKPGSGKLSLPALPAGQSATVTFSVKLTKKAKPKSTISLTGTAAGLTAKGSVVVKSAG